MTPIEKQLRDALAQSAEQFRLYEREHRAKAGVLSDGDAVASSTAKAETNERFARLCESVPPSPTRPELPKNLDTIEWLLGERDRVAKERDDCSMGDPTNNILSAEADYLYRAAQELQKNRARIEIFTKVLRNRGIAIAEPVAQLCPTTGIICTEAIRCLPEGR